MERGVVPHQVVSDHFQAHSRKPEGAQLLLYAILVYCALQRRLML